MKNCDRLHKKPDEKLNVDYRLQYFAGNIQAEGTYICKNCGKKFYLENGLCLPNCPRCGHSVFTKQ